MLAIYAQFLLTDLLPGIAPADTALAASANEFSSSEPPCPYSHIREHPPLLPTVPQFDTIVIDDVTLSGDMCLTLYDSNVTVNVTCLKKNVTCTRLTFE